MYALLADGPSVNIFGFNVYAYALIIVSGMIVAFFVISLLFRRRNMSKDLFLTYFCAVLPFALLTTRLFYCITDGMPISEWLNPKSIRSGGLSIIGGILGGALGVAVVSWIKKVNFFRVGDCIVVGLLIAQAIGRWGNFANQEVYGKEVTNGALQFFPFAVYINDGGSCLDTFRLTFAKLFGGSTDISGGTWHYAFFFYESLFNLLTAIVLFINAWKNPKKPNGINVAAYFIHYGLIRSIMEPLRDPTYILSGGGIPWSLVTALLLLASGTGLLVFLLVNNKKKEGKLFGSLTGDEYGITKFIKDGKNEIACMDKINMMCKIYPENYQVIGEGEKGEEEKKEKEE